MTRAGLEQARLKLATLSVQLRAVVIKEVRQTVRDRRVMFLLLVAPLVQVIVFGYAIEFEVDRVPTVVVDLDQSADSREHIQRLLADGTLQEVASTDSVGEAQAQLDAGTVSVGLVVPPDFSRDLARGEPASIQLLLDGTDPNRSAVAGAAVGGYLTLAGLDLAEDRLAQVAAARGVPLALPSVQSRPRVYYNPSMASPTYMVPGIAAMLLVIVTTIVTAMGLAREREMGTLEQVLVTPIQPGVLMVGKMLPYVFVGLFDVALALTIGNLLFDVPLRGDLIFLGFATAAYLMTTLGTGLYISTISTSQQQAFMGGFFFMLPAVLLSGIMTPITSMPEWLQPLTWLNPVRFFVEIMRSVLLKGAGFSDLWLQFLMLVIYGAVILSVASLRFSKRVG